ncbi:response regulator transcription factor [Ferviditalea candida]|uniref:Response regulator transcription factor n=1 Tax=Ferviditalea candida TaxID=3108399 RepID=A0ABU5ZMR2_9BACL|nr:response regulator transcription factor [Paenibacillaceae bacterium T2]
MENRILVVDDDPSISKLIEFHLKLAGFEVQCVHDGDSVLNMVNDYRPSLIVLDVMLPKMDGIQVCRKLRGQNNMTPIIMLSALHEIPDKIVGLDNGADDYMTKPFSPQELISRIHSVVRRVRPFLPADEYESIQIGSIEIFPEQREVTVDGKSTELTPKEFELLYFLCKHKGKVMSRRQLLHGVWDYNFLEDTRIVDVHISHLRDKIEKNSRDPEYIITIRNVGYKLKDPGIGQASMA